MNLKFTKVQLEAALEARRPWARAYDKKRVVQHAREEKEHLQKFRNRLREALKWSYETSKENHFETGLNRYNERGPMCPEGVEANLDRVISQVAMDGRERYVLSAMPVRRGGSDFSDIYWLLTHDENAKKDVCEV